MNEKLNRLAKGMIDGKTPKAELTPASFSESVDFAGSGRREFSLRSLNGVPLRGLVYSDNPRVRIENAVFTGGRNRILFEVDPSFLTPQTVIFGQICLLTNAGEFSLPYRFTVTGTPPEEQRRTDRESAVTLTADHDPRYLREAGQPGLNAFEEMIVSEFPEDEPLFEELCAMLIRAQCTDAFAFSVYAEAVRRDLRLTRLYEYYLFSVPDSYDEPMPREVLLYFSYDTVLEPAAKSALYQNILLYQNPDSELFRQYEPQIRDYAMQSLLAGRMDERLAVIYPRMIYPEQISGKMANLLPALLSMYRVSCLDSRMTRVVLRTGLLRGEESYPLNRGQAYVPIYLAETEVLFQDSLGRYYSGVSCTFKKVCENAALLERCYAVDPRHPMHVLGSVSEILSRGIRTDEEKETLLYALDSFALSEDTRDRIAAAAVRYGAGPQDLSRIETDRLSASDRQKLFSDLVSAKRARDAFSLARRYGLLIAEKDALARMCLSLITEEEPFSDTREERFFLSACRIAFDKGARDGQLLTYLAKTYDGSTEDMYRILSEGLAAGADTGTLSERTLIAKLFADTRIHLDECFAAYLTRSPREILVRAYLTVRCADYFLQEEKVPELVFETLYEYLLQHQDRERLPSIYLLAFTRHEEETKIKDPTFTSGLLSALIADDLCFSYTGRLLRKLRIRSPLRRNTVIEYHGDRDRKPWLFVKIEPEDESFHAEEMKRVYQGIYTRAFRLFSDDRLLYRICADPAGTLLLSEGEASGKSPDPDDGPDSRFELLDRMSALLDGEETEALSDAMMNYALQDAKRRALFQIKAG